MSDARRFQPPAPSDRMGAIGFRRYGGVDVLEPLDLPLPALGPHSVLIRVIAAGVNPADWAIRSGALRLFVRLRLPFVPGLDVAGVVAAVGEQVTRFRPGDAVYTMLPPVAGGGYAEYAAASEAAVALLPVTASFTEAAAVPCAALTALQALRDVAKLRPGAHVLVNGASGGVGTFGVQIAKALGAHVTAAASARNMELVRLLGADEVLDYTQVDVTAGDARYDVVLDAVGALAYGRARRSLRPGGVMVTVNFNRANPLALLRARLDRAERRLGTLLVAPNGADLALLAEWIDFGKVRPIVERTFTLAEAAEAQRASAGKRVRGKLVLVVDEAIAATQATVSHETRDAAAVMA
jgi:NADPH:quinone reductase-like Zn-dependent oxidoreductase